MAGEIRDTNLKVTKALPAAGATNYSDSIDLIDTNPGIKMRNAEIEVVLPATASLADTKSVTLTLQDSADDSTFADIEQLAAISVTASGGAGGSAVTRKFKIPEDVARYIRLKQVITSSGGDNTAVSTTTSVVY